MGITACTGKLADQHYIKDWYPSDSFITSTNGVGGASGSILVDMGGRAVGLVYALATNQGLYAVPMRGIQDDLEHILAGKVPPRSDNGIIPKYINIYHATKYYNFPAILTTEFKEKFPEANNRLLQVGGILSPQSPISSAEVNKIEVGDIIWSVNGVKIGHDLYKYRKHMNESIDRVTIQVYRNGKEQIITTNTFDLNAVQCNQFFDIGGVIISSANLQTSFTSGAKMGSVGIFASHTAGSSFPDLPFWTEQGRGSHSLCLLKKINGQKIKTLQDVESIIPEIVKKGAINYTFQNLGQGPSNRGDPSYDKGKKTGWGDFNVVKYSYPKKITFDRYHGLWKSIFFNGEQWED